MTPRSDSPIAIIGAGAIGLSTAIRLLEQRARVAIFAASRTPRTTSDRSGAVFTPTKSGENPRIHAWTRRSFEAFSSIARDLASPYRGVTLGLSREYFLSPHPDQPWWRDFSPHYRRITSPCPLHADAYEIRAPRMDITRYIASLEARALELGAAIHDERIPDFASLFARGHTTIVNCSGLGARDLARDNLVFPMRGQVLHTPNDIGLDVTLHEECAEPDLATYIFPYADHIVLGGTYEPKVWEEATDPAALDGVVRRCRELLRRLDIPGADRLGEKRLRWWGGLRPARIVGDEAESVRLEAERIAPSAAGPGGTVVHNYGHGRAGITLSWGCAEEAARLALA